MKPRVSVLRTSYALEDAEVEKRVSRMVEEVGGLPEELGKAEKILLKPNLGGSDPRRYKGRLVALTEPCISRAVLRLIRGVNPDADIIAVDGGWPTKGGSYREALQQLSQETGHDGVFREFGVRLVDASEEPYVKIPVPGGGRIMRYYYFNRELADVEATVSIQKLKVHLYSGVSLTIKNLFGLPPVPPYGWAARSYLHYLVRLPPCLVDLAAIFRPCLNIIDGLIGEELQEWQGPPVESNVLAVGDNPVATDAVGTMLMGFNPQAEFPEEPNLFDISHLNMASGAGLAPNDPRQIEMLGDDVESAKTRFRKRFAGDTPPEYHEKARKQLCQDALFYRDNVSRFSREYRGKYIGLQEQKVLWSADGMDEIREKMRRLHFTFREKLTPAYKAPFIKKVEPEESDPEVYDAYT